VTTFLDRGRTVVRSGWIPFALVVFAFLGVAHHSAAVPWGDALKFAGYLVGWIVFPGTVAWRLVDPRAERRPLVEDLAVGALVGYVLEFPVYMAFLALGHPHWYLGWPVVPLIVVLTPWARRIRHVGRGRMPVWWSWATAVVSLYAISWFGRYAWPLQSVRPAALRTPYIDEPFHLALATSLKHFFPPRVTYVADTPLNYHYLSHLHIAASSWVTGVEPIVLLRALVIPAALLIVILAAGLVAARVSGALWTSLLLYGTLAIVPIGFTGWGTANGEGLLDDRVFLSPSAGFVNAALVLGILLCLDQLTLPKLKVPALALTLLSFVAMTGAKSTSLPTLLGGLVLATVVSSVAARRIDVRALVLTVLAGIGFEAAKLIFFGPGSHGLALDPLALTETKVSTYAGLAGPDGAVPFHVRVIVASYMASYLTLGAGALALLARSGWRRAHHVFLVGTCLAGIGAGLAFHQSSYSEYYFIFVVVVPTMLAAALGVQHLVSDWSRPRILGYGAAALLAGVVGAIVFPRILHLLHPAAIAGSGVHIALLAFAMPVAVLLVLVAVATAVIVLIGRRAGSRDGGSAGLPGTLVLVVSLVFAGLGSGPFLRHTAPGILDHPVSAPSAWPYPAQIGRGGVKAARWLRGHSGVDDLIATNAHCQAGLRFSCIPRNFWMAGYAERQFLVEGWSYVSRWSVGGHPPADEDVTAGPFWDPDRLAANDRAFVHPTADALAYLAQHEGVRWLFVDRKAPVRLKELESLADLRYDDGRYLIFRLRP
jgi:hypothetical protein